MIDVRRPAHDDRQAHDYAENGITTRLPGSHERKHVCVTLCQRHLLKMDPVEIIDYDGVPRDGQAAGLGLRGEMLPAARSCRRRADPWLDPTMAAFIGGVVILFTAGALGFGPISAVSPPI